jgi:hypothetical protein
MVDELVEKGADRAEAEVAVAELAGEHPLIDLLKSLDWAKIIDILIKLLVKV